ncbi:MAG: P-type conjugative transfer protein TrbJ [Myxococcaceae bacterium]|nr:P-type conjugative transfer protein TrbJ [Myxococcaceae bacterium]
MAGIALAAEPQAVGGMRTLARRCRRNPMFLLAFAAVLSAAAPLPVRAASALAGSLEPTQISNFIQLLQQCIKMEQAVKHAQAQVNAWKTNLAAFKDMNHFQMAGALITDVSSMIGQYRSIVFGANASIETFKKMYPGYQEPANQTFAQARQKLDQETMTSVQRSLQAMDVQLTDEKGGLKGEDRLIQELQSKSQSAAGVVQALSVTNEWLALHAKQLQRLELTMIAQGQAMNHYLAGELQRRSYDEVARDDYFKFDDRPLPTPVDWSHEGSKGLL